MPSYFDRGVFTTSTWHKLEEIGAMPDAKAMIAHGENSGAWPVEILEQAVLTSAGVEAPAYNAIVGRYALEEHADRVLGIVGGRYNATSPAQWRQLVRAAVAAGAKPTGAFSLRDGSRVLATFEVSDDKGIKTNLVLADAFDGSSRLLAGFTSIRVVCANTIAAAFSRDGKSWAKIRHTSSLDEKINRLREGVEQSIKSGRKVVEAFEAACEHYLDRDAAIEAFNALFPEAPEDASKAAKTRAENLRHEARLAAALPCNRVGDKPGNLATLWNAATYLVDRKADGSMRKTRGGADNMVDSMLFGSRAKRVNEIETLVEVLMADGTTESMSVPQAVESGVDTGQIGSSLLASMLDD